MKALNIILYYIQSGLSMMKWMIFKNHPPSQNHMDDGSASSTLGVDDWADFPIIPLGWDMVTTQK